MLLGCFPRNAAPRCYAEGYRQTDVINARARAAFLKRGARLRGHARRDIRRVDGSWRDAGRGE